MKRSFFVLVQHRELYRQLSVLCVVAVFFGAPGCAVFWNGETQGDFAMKRAQADAVRAYSRQYRPDNLGVAASPFGTSRRIEIQAPSAVDMDIYENDSTTRIRRRGLVAGR